MSETMDGGTPSQDECQRALEQLIAFLDHELTEADTDHIRTHLNLCEQCLDTYDLTQHVKDLVRKECASAAPDALRAKILGSLKL